MTKVKQFFAYFWHTLKDGKFLLLKYIVAAILLSVVSVLANLLQVRELTYLNAVLAVGYFASLLSFGVSQGTNVLTNQNIEDQSLVKKYVRSGFWFVIILLLVFVALWCAFPKFIMESLTSFVPDDYTFYYLMSIYAFFYGVKEYFANTLKQLEIFRLQFVSEVATIFITIVGLVVLYFAGIYFLNYIAIAYIMQVVVGSVLGFVFLQGNKILKINIFKKPNLKLTKRQWWILISNLLVEMVWEVGYFATSVFLLRMSDALLNTYSYLEVVLDVFNGFLFAFVNITCIKITRSLGQNNFDEAKLHAKNSIAGTLVIWMFYLLCSLALIYPVALGVNKEYFNLIFLAVPCYVGLHFIRFLKWNFSSYMLRCGGRTDFGKHKLGDFGGFVLCCQVFAKQHLFDLWADCLARTDYACCLHHNIQARQVDGKPHLAKAARQKLTLAIATAFLKRSQKCQVFS